MEPNENDELLMKINSLRENLMTFTSIRMTYADENYGNDEIKQLLDEVSLKTLKKIKSLSGKIS